MIKISVSIQGHRTSITLEKEFFDALKNMAKNKQISLAKLIENIESKRNPMIHKNLSSFIRVFLFEALLNNNS